jgi:hypothetical protein
VELVFGVIDIPYVEYDEKGKPKKKKKSKKSTQNVKKGSTATTGSVAEDLEKKYKIMAKFYELHEDEIAVEIVKSLEGSIVNMLATGHMPSDNSTGFDEAAEAIQEKFKKFLDTEEMAHTGTPGVPTEAALRGVNHRLKVSRGARRPSFIDTGQYQAAMKVWVK